MQKWLEFEGFKTFFGYIIWMEMHKSIYVIKFERGRKWLKKGPFLFFVPPVKICILRVLSILELLQH